jgi:hypothetical protein
MSIYDFQMPKNKNGHHIIPVLGNSILGETEVDYLRRWGGVTLSDTAKEILSSSVYNDSHRLENILYTVVLVSSRELIAGDLVAIQKFAKKHKYHELLAGAMPRLRDVVSFERREAMGFDSIIGFHDPIESDDCGRYRLEISSIYGNDTALTATNEGNIEHSSTVVWIRPRPVAFAFFVETDRK